MHSQELDLPETGQNNIQKKILEIGPDAVLAIGMDALNSVGKLNDLPIFYTMLTELMPEFADKRKKYSGSSMDILPETYLSYMKRLFPKAKRVGIIYSRRNAGQFVNEAFTISNSIGLEIIAREVSTPSRVPAVIESMKEKIDIFWMLPDPEVITSETVNAILLFSFQNNVPVFSFSNKYVKMRVSERGFVAVGAFCGDSEELFGFFAASTLRTAWHAVCDGVHRDHESRRSARNGESKSNTNHPNQSGGSHHVRRNA